MMLLLEGHPASFLPQWGHNQYNPPLLTEMIPQHILDQKIISYLTQKDIRNFQLFLYKKVFAVLKIRNPQKRSTLLRKYLMRYDPSYYQNYLLRLAAAKGMFDVVEILLQYPGVDPSAKNNWALIMARENKHLRVYNLLADFHRDLELGLGLGEEGSIESILMGIIDSGAQMSVDIGQDCLDLNLLFKTSTKLLPHLKQGIIHAIEVKRNELAKIMLYFVSFDYSYFNHMVYFKQLAAGNSILALRKIDPFVDTNNGSLIIAASRSKNVEIVNFILDKGLKWNPLTILRWYYCKRWFILERAHDLLATDLENGEQDLIPTDLENSERDLLSNRLLNIILNHQRYFFGLIGLIILSIAFNITPFGWAVWIYVSTL